MRKKHFLFAALFFAALVFGFSACENPNGDLLNNGNDNTGITDNDSTTNNPDQGGDNNGGNTERPVPDISSTLVATGAATDVEYSNVTLWGRLNTDSLPMVGNVTGWGIEYAYNRESVELHKHSEITKVKCNTELQGENADEFSVKCSDLTGGVTIYYSAYALVDMKYIYGEVDSVQMLVRLTANPNNNEYGMVSGSGNYELGSEVTITATPNENYYLEGWSDCDSKELVRTIKLTSSDTTFTANFAKKPYLTVKTNNSNYGTVSGSSGYYMPGEEVTITATPNSGAYFVEWNDGNTDNPRTVTVNEDITYTATFAEVLNGTENGYEWVGLGLPSGTKWATCNVGATTPEGYGNYYAWGETEPKTTYDWSTYKWCNGSSSTLTKYNTSSDYGTVDNKTVLEPEDDAAAVNWGGAWRMPTDAEWTELRTNCTWTWTTLNGKNGYEVKSKINGNSIFLPAAGCRLDDLGGAGSYGLYWSSSLGTGFPSCAWYAYFLSDFVVRSNGYRCYGQSVRPVLGE